MPAHRLLLPSRPEPLSPAHLHTPAPALPPHCRQAFGARNYRALGCILQRALLVNLAFGAAIAVAWLK